LRKDHKVRTTAHGKATTSSDLHVEYWGNGTPVVLVHGSLATGAQEWQAQRPLADETFRLVVFDRRGYGRSPAAAGEDFIADAADIAALLGDGAHLVGHSYGGLGAMLAAAERPESTLSLTLLEPAVTTCGLEDPAWSGLVDSLRTFWRNRDLADDEWVVEFLVAVGSNPAEFPAEFLTEAATLAPLLRNGRPPFDADLPLEAVREAAFPKLVVSGGHHVGFDAMCRDLADRIGAERATVAGAGHEIQFTGHPLNDLLTKLWHPSFVQTTRLHR
jgi:pimeloyl-ACP methyl ester carboxylesterase